jgi:hypothetical protein
VSEPISSTAHDFEGAIAQDVYALRTGGNINVVPGRCFLMTLAAAVVVSPEAYVSEGIFVVDL